jgi:Spy/CpxP family protein refolding chaperone
MKTKTMILGTVGVLLAAGLAAVAGPQVAAVHAGHGGGDGGPMMIPHMVGWLVDQALDDANATQAQRARVQVVKDRLAVQAQAMQADHGATHEEFKREWSDAKMDSARLHALVDERVEEMRRLLHASVDGLVEVHDTLTPEQRKQLVERAESMHAGK